VVKAFNSSKVFPSISQSGLLLLPQVRVTQNSILGVCYDTGLMKREILSGHRLSPLEMDKHVTENCEQREYASTANRNEFMRW